MNNISHTLLLLLSSVYVFGQGLTYSEKREWRRELKKMEASDQFYRQMMRERPDLNSDSLWALQTANDSVNKVRFVALTQKYGYPSRKNIGREASLALILHFTNKQDSCDLQDLFRKELFEGRMLPAYYAWWYDRCLRNMNQPIFFGQYTNDVFCGEQLKLFNERRREIGLEVIEGKANCDE